MPEELNPFASPLAVDSDRPEMAWAVDDPEALRRVKLGLTLVYFGICAVLLLLLASPFLGFMMFEQIGQGPGDEIAWVGLALGGLFLLLTLVIFAGEILCTAVPRESGAKTLAMAAVVLQGLSLGIGLLMMALDQLSPFAVAVVGQGLSNLLAVASLVCFILFMRRLALFIQRRDVAGRATRSLIVGVVAVVLMIAGGAIFGIGMAAPGGPARWAPILMSVGGIALFVAFIMYANTVTYLRKAIMI